MSEDQVRIFRDTFGNKSVYFDDYEKLRARIAEQEKQISGLVARIDEIQEQSSERIAELEVNYETMLSECVRLNDEKKQLRARIAELEMQRTNMEQEISGMDSMVDAKAALLQAANARISELEAAQQWHPASEPPEDDRYIYVDHDGCQLPFIGTRRHLVSPPRNCFWRDIDRRDLPPLPVKP